MQRTVIINASDFQTWKYHTCCRVWGAALLLRLCLCVRGHACAAWKVSARGRRCLVCLSTKRRRRVSVTLQRFTAGDLYWWGVKKPWYRKCIHQRVSSSCLLQSKPCGFSRREAASKRRSCLGKERNPRYAVCVILCFGFICWLVLPYEIHGNGFWFSGGSCLIPLIGSSHDGVLRRAQFRCNLE